MFSVPSLDGHLGCVAVDQEILFSLFIEAEAVVSSSLVLAMVNPFFFNSFLTSLALF